MRVSELSDDELKLAAKARELYRQNSPKQVAAKLGVSPRYVRMLWERITHRELKELQHVTPTASPSQSRIA